jgi:hypothetical protein
MREAQIEAYLVKRVEALGGECRKVKWIGRRGAPDRLVMLPWSREHRGNTTVWVELKATGVTPEPHQMREHARMQAMGQSVVVIDSIEGVDAWLSPEPVLLSIEEVARRFNLKLSFLQRDRKKETPTIPFVRVGGAVRYDAEVVKRSLGLG